MPAPARCFDGAGDRAPRSSWLFATFLSAARFVNALDNGTVLSMVEAERHGFHDVTYRVRLSGRTERGMCDLRHPAATRSGHRGVVVPGQDEWVKAAYFDPAGGGTVVLEVPDPPRGAR